MTQLLALILRAPDVDTARLIDLLQQAPRLDALLAEIPTEPPPVVVPGIAWQVKTPFVLEPPAQPRAAPVYRWIDNAYQFYRTITVTFPVTVEERRGDWWRVTRSLWMQAGDLV